MKIGLPETDRIRIDYHTHDLPPPFSYEFEMDLDLKSGKVDFRLNYTGREDLEEDEIIDEGFSLDDDFFWEGVLPEVWRKAFMDFLAASEFQNAGTDILPFQITLSPNEKSLIYVPANIERWEVFFQEALQALYELEGKAQPLVIKMMEIKEGRKQILIFRLEFLNRFALAASGFEGDLQEKSIPWTESRDVLRTIYIPDYLPEKAREKAPAKPGFYIDPGEGFWFKLGEGVIKPTKESKILERLQKLFTDFTG